MMVKPTSPFKVTEVCGERREKDSQGEQKKDKAVAHEWIVKCAQSDRNSSDRMATLNSSERNKRTNCGRVA
jgi:hypothetical protein